MLAVTSLFIPCSRDDFQETAFVLHGETILWGQVHGLSWHWHKLQLLDQDGQEEVDFISCNHLSNAAALSHPKEHDRLPQQPVDFNAISTQETVWVEGRWVFPLLPETYVEGHQLKSGLDKLVCGVKKTCYSPELTELCWLSESGGKIKLTDHG